MARVGGWPVGAMRQPPTQSPPRRTLLTLTALALTAREAPTLLRPSTAFALDGSADELQKQYSAGARAGGGRGANALLKARAESGVRRIGGSPIFKPGSILDGVRSDDGSAVDITFTYPEAWTSNLDVRDVRSSDSAFLLVALLPAGKSIETLSKSFFTDLLFAKDGKYGSYGGVDDFSLKDWELTSLNTPSGGAQQYRRCSIRFSALTYNANTVERRAKMSATALGGSVFVLVAGCLGTRFKDAGQELASAQTSFRAYSSGRAAALEAAARHEEEERLREADADELAQFKALDGGRSARRRGVSDSAPFLAPYRRSSACWRSSGNSVSSLYSAVQRDSLSHRVDNSLAVSRRSVCRGTPVHFPGTITTTRASSRSIRSCASPAACRKRKRATRGGDGDRRRTAPMQMPRGNDAPSGPVPQTGAACCAAITDDSTARGVPVWGNGLMCTATGFLGEE
eukprot:3598481-Prymnesium_polylepis.1